MTRHCSVLFDRTGPSRFEALYHADSLRTFLPLFMTPRYLRYLPGNFSTSMHELFSKLKFLRVFSLFGYPDVTELPDTIENLKHLRYLNVSGTGIRKLPDSLCSLYNLQILKLSRCASLEELPLNLHKLVNLCYLDFSGTKVKNMPMNMEKLKNLEVLVSFHVDNGNDSNIQQLREMNLHGELSISELQNIVNPLDALSANLKSKIHLEKLELKWNADSNIDNSQKEREVFEMLQPSKHLKELLIRGYGGTLFPAWFGDSSLLNVVSLELRNCKNCVWLPPLGVLPSLKELRIVELTEIVVIGSEFYGIESSSSPIIPFPSLEMLTFQCMSSWEKWECDIVNGAFPRLQKLSMLDCPNLKGNLPKKLDCLMYLQIYGCKQLVASVPRSPAIHELRLDDCGKLQFDDHHSSSLTTLDIRKCCMEGSSVEWIWRTLCHNHTSIQSLHIQDFPTMNIPLHCCFNFLKRLSITRSCDSLRTFPLDLFPKLGTLNLQKCSNLEMISQVVDRDLKLEYLTVEECPKFASFPKGGLSAPKLWYFGIGKLENLKSLPECMHILLPSLHFVIIDDCPQLESFSDGGLPSNLRELKLVKCSELLIDSLKWALPTNTSLNEMLIKEADVEPFPNQGLLLHSLTHLYFSDCPNLKQLDCLRHLTSLTTLSIYNCPSLQCLPEEGVPKSISSLYIKGKCVLLKPRCEEPNGEDWEKISHIKFLEIQD